jgi:hypothetical protein
MVLQFKSDLFFFELIIVSNLALIASNPLDISCLNKSISSLIEFLFSMDFCLNE